MPHIPRTGIPGTQAPHAKESVPVTRNDEAALKKKVSIEKISMKKWEVDPLKIYKALFGREANVDEYTRHVVHTRPPGRDSRPT